MKKYILIFIGVFTISSTIKAQDGIANILFADLADANTLTTEYLRPAAEGFIYGLSNGWFHSAKVHKPLGFDISIGGNLSTPPSNREIFTLSTLSLSDKITKNPATSPTVLGSDVALSNAFEVTIPADSDTNINGGIHPQLKKNFTMPNGYKEDFPLKSIPTPAVQVTVGLPWDLEATVRMLPEVGTDDAKGELLGFGLKKEITSWFGPLDKLPLHVSVLGAFTNMKVSSVLTDPSGNEINITNGLTELKMNSYTVQAIASLNFPIVSVYGGFGYVSGTSTLDVSGRYELQYSDGPINYTKILNNPIKLDYDISGMRATLGARLSLGFFKIYGSYTIQEYNTINAGIAIGIR